MEGVSSFLNKEKTHVDCAQEAEGITSILQNSGRGRFISHSTTSPTWMLSGRIANMRVMQEKDFKNSGMD